MFEQTKKLTALEQAAVRGVAFEAAPAAEIFTGRPHYLPVSEREMEAFLARTKMDRYRWREAQPAGDGNEMVCASFSLLLWALLEQERLMRGLTYPLAVARVHLELQVNGETKGHSLCAFVNEFDQFKLIEPQNDRIYIVPEDQVIWEAMFQ